MTLDNHMNNQGPSRRQFLRYAAAATLAYALGCGGKGKGHSQGGLEKSVEGGGQKYFLNLSTPEKAAQHYFDFRYRENPDFKGIKAITHPAHYDRLRDFLEEPPGKGVKMIIGEGENQTWFIEVIKTDYCHRKGEDYGLPTAHVVGKINIDQNELSTLVKLIKKDDKWLVTSVSR